MDSLAGLLDGPRAREAFLLRSSMDPPWSLAVEDEAPLCLVAVVRGSAWILPGGADEAVRLGAGDVAVVRGPERYVVADDPATDPQMIILPGQRCVTVDGREVKPMNDLGTRWWGTGRDGETVMLTGTYQLRSEVSRRLLAAIPRLVTLPGGGRQDALVRFLADEVIRDEPGQEAVLDRLLDVLLVATLRAWFARPEAAAPGWYSAHADPVVGPALRLLQDDPAHPWTVASLAAAAGSSRAGLARRFTELVGEPPMTYLTDWRLTLAADLLREPGATLSAVAHRVGYGSPFALSAAFKRVRGMSPQEFRAAGAQAG